MSGRGMGFGIMKVLEELQEEAGRRRKAPPPPKAIEELRRHFELSDDLCPLVMVVQDGVVMTFAEETQFVLMSAKGARQLAGRLVEKADELEGRKEKAG